MSAGRRLPPFAEKLLLVGLGFVAVQAALIPLEPGGELVAPDLLYALMVGWVIRRPGSTPLWAAPLLGLFADLMLSRPLGLGALGLMVATEAFRTRARLFHGSPFVIEWLAATVVFAAVLGAMQLVLTILAAHPPGLGPLSRHLLATALAYPLVVLGLTWCLRLRAPQAQASGNPLGRLR
jgi:rod shape-determining protein MreD